MKTNLRHLLPVWLTLALLLTGCGASSKSDMAITEAYAAPSMEEVYYDDIENGAVADSASFSSASTTASTNATADANDLANRKLIREASLTVETKTYDDFVTQLEQQLADTGAYVQNAETTGNAERGNRWAYYTIRVPADRYDTLLSSVSSLGNVTYKSENIQDVTMAYTDTEAKIRALEVEEETLLEILAKCENVADVITVQSRISEVQYQLDSYRSKLRQYDNLISYCTIGLTIDEVEKVSIPVAEKTVGQRIREDLADNCEDIVEDTKDFAVWFVSSLPYLGIWLVIIGAVLLLALGLGRRSHRKLQARQQQRRDHASASSDTESRSDEK